MLGGGDGLLFGGVPDIDGGVDCVGQLALASITDPSGHVLVVGDGGVNVCVHDGSFGFFVQSTGGSVVPAVQLPAAHVDPDPFPPDPGTVKLVAVGLDAVDDIFVVIFVPDGVDVVAVILVGHVPLYPGELHVNGGFGGGHVILSLVHTDFGICITPSHPNLECTHVSTNAS